MTSKKTYKIEHTADDIRAIATEFQRIPDTLNGFAAAMDQAGIGAVRFVKGSAINVHRKRLADWLSRIAGEVATEIARRESGRDATAAPEAPKTTGRSPSKPPKR